MKKWIVMIVSVLTCIGIGGCTKEENQALTTLEISNAEYTVCVLSKCKRGRYW